MRITLDVFPGGKHKALTMSYDDGTIHDRRLVEIFNKYGIRGSFHLNSGKFGSSAGRGHINSDEIATLFEGHEISAHTLTHPHLPYCTQEGIIYEVMEDRRLLEELAGYPVRGMSYPFGTYNDTVLKALPGLGIEYSRTVKSHGQYTLPEDFLQWHPTCHHKNADKHVNDFVNLNTTGGLRLLYIWGHSYEFEDIKENNNWDYIEDICNKLANHDDIWYATNIEIVDYMKALSNLRFSASQQFVYNPSSISVWIKVDGKEVEVKAGATISLNS